MFDLLLKNGTVIDGTGKAGYRADVAIADGKISKIAPDLEVEAAQVIDAEGMIVSPGFIDIHSHSDICPFIEGLEPESKLYQGITLEIIGNCGLSNLPVNPERREEITRTSLSSLQLAPKGYLLEDDTITDYGEHLKAKPACTNVGALVGHGTIRACVVGLGMKKATAEDMVAMEALLDRELSRGAFGMSLGLTYPPSAYGDIEEFVGLAKVLKKHEALLTVHMRSESTKIFEALEEMITVAEQSGVHLQISHLKLMGKPQWGKADKLLQRIKEAKARGVNITCDQYPYLATSTGLTALIPKWAHDGGRLEMCKRLENPSEQLMKELNQEMERRGGAQCVLVASTNGSNPQYDGKTLDIIAQEMGCEPDMAACKLLIAAGGGVNCCYFTLNQEDMLKIMKEKFIAVGTDGYAFCFDKGFLKVNPHPRSFGTFPRFFQTVRENKLMSLEEAVYKATGLSADILGIPDRGRLEEGKRADVTIFDAEKLEDKAVYTDSLRKPQGIKAVIIDGKLALLDGERCNGRLGGLVKHNA